MKLLSFETWMKFKFNQHGENHKDFSL